MAVIKVAREQLKNLTEPMYYILLTLTSPGHGYEIMQRIAESSGGRVRVGAGTLYTLLARFEREDIICQVSDDGRRKTYNLTSKGKDILDKEYHRLQTLVSDGSTFLKG